MGLFDILKRLLGFGPRPDTGPAAPPGQPAPPPESLPGPASATIAEPSPQKRASAREAHEQPARRVRVVLKPLRYQSNLIPTSSSQEIVSGKPYRFAGIGPQQGQFRDLSRDIDQRWLDYFGLPVLATPDDLAAWLNIPIGQLAWLTHRTSRGHRAESVKQSHYVYSWIAKRSGGHRLIESPKSDLKHAQEQILRGLLDHVPPHTAAHGFVPGRSILTNASPHVGQRFVLKFDLRDFYVTVRYSRVVAIFRSLGYSREVAIWLARLTTSSVPWGIKAPVKEWELAKYASRHLPQGAPTSPALANLSAFGLDVRLDGLAGAYGLEYTRYADDLTFSGPGTAIPALHELIPLIQKIIRAERFSSNWQKRRVLRNGQRQTVAGVVVNEKLNVSRRDYDSLKATLHNCRKLGPSTQNHKSHPEFASHLRGRIAHVRQLNPARGEKLLAIYQQIDWSK
ncbi:reverse transcriptase family protein [Planctomicrobium piriforme]|uniref:RNA-directed DNA polymerase n=1 Tax=Planctomicrobium piriforme TaxID=1576369 RepID=A0A1I3J1U1_9PLAN|nr:reverse transcriptase family protein [Planctomicrobium piriforme]SFI53948.1 Reverse transcriptase (RNA-dependent DNA polymerase) [Planctomicrobium piriforme]